MYVHHLQIFNLRIPILSLKLKVSIAVSTHTHSLVIYALRFNKVSIFGANPASWLKLLNAVGVRSELFTRRLQNPGLRAIFSARNSEREHDFELK